MVDEDGCYTHQTCEDDAADKKRERNHRIRHGPVLTLYHETDEYAAAAIIESQRFYRGESGLAGGGIYFASSPEKAQLKSKHRGVVLVADVQMGNSKNVDRDGGEFKFTDLMRQGYDSVIIRGRSSGSEYVVYNYDQVKNIRKARF